jgi:hypothetical protein
MMKIGRLSLLALLVLFVLSAGVVIAKDTIEKPLTLAKLTEQVDKLDKTEIVLTGTVVGVCKSGCKMWIADGEYKKGDPYALVRAKDDAFKFDKEATGKTVVLHGFAVAKYMDYCAESGDKKEGAAMDKCETPVTLAKDQKVDEKKEGMKVKDITFFATTVEYK